MSTYPTLRCTGHLGTEYGIEACPARLSISDLPARGDGRALSGWNLEQFAYGLGWSEASDGGDLCPACTGGRLKAAYAEYLADTERHEWLARALGVDPDA